jgi:hypothetical protein
VELPQLAEFARLATPLARFGKVGRAASKQRVGSPNLPRRAIFQLLAGNPRLPVRDLDFNLPQHCHDLLRLASLHRHNRSSLVGVMGPRFFDPKVGLVSGKI